MNRISIKPRDDWQSTVKNLGLDYYDEGSDGVYWNESAYYSFTNAEVDKMYLASKEIFNLCMKAIDYIIDNDLFHKFAIAPQLAQEIINSWDRDDPTLYGRLDLSIGKDGNYKLLEFNADTPTSLFEAGLIQYNWLTDTFSDGHSGGHVNQYNSIYETLFQQFKYIKTRLPQNYGELYFTSVKEPVEDVINTHYMMAIAQEAGITCKYIVIDDIGYDGQNFVDNDNYIINHMFKLYPWEWLMQEDFGKNVLSMQTWLEPMWKMLLSNKAILPVLWKIAPNHANLLAAYFEDEVPADFKNNCVTKPIYSREGCNISVTENGQETLKTDGMYEHVPLIYQETCVLPKFDDKYACLGAWIVGDEPCGLGIRESDTIITRNDSKFVPHTIEG